MTVELHYKLHSKLLPVICTVKITFVWLGFSLSVVHLLVGPILTYRFYFPFSVFHSGFNCMIIIYMLMVFFINTLVPTITTPIWPYNLVIHI